MNAKKIKQPVTSTKKVWLAMALLMAGLAAHAATVTIAPSRRHWVAPTLQIAVSPTIQRSLLDLFEPATHPSDNPADTTIGTEGLPAASDLMAALALAKLYPADTSEGRMLDERIRTTLSLLIATQHEGNWSINGHESSIATNALAYSKLTRASTSLWADFSNKSNASPQ